MEIWAKIIIIGIIILIVIGLIFGLYYYLYKKAIENNNKGPPLYNAFFKCVDDVNESSDLIGNFKVYLNSTLFTEGECSKGGYTEYKIPAKQMLEIIGSSESYYSSRVLMYQQEDNVSHIMSFYKIGNWNISKSGEFKEGVGEINLTITTDSQIRNIKFCLNWGVDTLSVSTNFKETPNITRENCDEFGNWVNDSYSCSLNCKLGFKDKKLISKGYCNTSVLKIPTRLKDKVIKCYNTYTTINDKENLSIILDYRNFEKIDSSDYIKIYFIDSDKIKSGEYISEDEIGNDVGGADYPYTINNINTECSGESNSEVCGV